MKYNPAQQVIGPSIRVPRGLTSGEASQTATICEELVQQRQ